MKHFFFLFADKVNEVFNYKINDKNHAQCPFKEIVKQLQRKINDGCLIWNLNKKK